MRNQLKWNWGILLLFLGLSVSAQTVQQETKTFKRAILVEEFSSSICGHCPRGHAGMERLRTQYGDAFVGIALHRSSADDPMYLPNYADLAVQGTPLCKVNRSAKPFTPEQGTDAVAAELKEPALLGIALEGRIDDATNTVKVEATIDSQLEGKCEIVYVLVADNLVGSTPDWLQANYMGETTYDGEASDPVSRFYKGGSSATNPYTQIYDDVAVASSYNSAGRTMAAPLELYAGQKSTSSFTLELPTTPKLVEPLKNADLYVVAFVTDAAGRVLNAAKAPVRVHSARTAMVVVSQGVTNGAIVVTPKGRVEAGTRVKLAVSPSLGYKLKAGSLKVYRADELGTELTIGSADHEVLFTMPAYNVIVTALFEAVESTSKRYQIAIDGNIKHGAIVVSPMHDVTAGTLLTVELKPVSGYRYKGCSLRYYKTNAPGLVVHLPKETFKMPNYDITLTADFERTGSNGGEGGLPAVPGDEQGTAVDDIDNAPIEISPNPFASTLKLVRDNDTNISALRYELVNAQGQVVCAGIFNGGETQIDTQNLPEGLYVVRILLPDLGTGKTFRVIKK